MKIYSQNNISFKAKPPELLLADKALRIMNTHYPTASNTRFIKLNRAKNSTKIQQDVALFGINFLFFRKRLFKSEETDNSRDFFKGFIKSIKNHNIANCYELVKLFSFILDLNGVEAKWASLLPSDINHCVALIPLKKDSLEKTDFAKTPISKMKDFLIADPWMGVVDFAPNIATLYKHHPDYNRCIGLPEKYTNLNPFILTSKLNDYYLQPNDYHSKDLTSEDKDFFIHNYPELLINKK